MGRDWNEFRRQQDGVDDPVTSNDQDRPDRVQEFGTVATFVVNNRIKHGHFKELSDLLLTTKSFGSSWTIGLFSTPLSPVIIAEGIVSETYLHDSLRIGMDRF